MAPKQTTTVCAKQSATPVGKYGKMGGAPCAVGSVPFRKETSAGPRFGAPAVILGPVSRGFRMRWRAVKTKLRGRGLQCGRRPHEGARPRPRGPICGLLGPVPGHFLLVCWAFALFCWGTPARPISFQVWRIVLRMGPGLWVVGGVSARLEGSKIPGTRGVLHG